MVRAAWDENLVLHLQSIYTIISRVFAYDAVSYAQYLPYCTVTMGKRVESHPGLSAEIWQRWFSVQIGSCDPFAKFLLIEPERNCQSWCPNCWWNKGIQLETNSSEKILLFRRIQKHSSALWNDTLYQFQQLSCWCPVVSNHKGWSVVAAIMGTLVHEI